ncbi:uncharacterized protein FIBRA_03218 [Fibroporia radiculosa]|uniref:YEATS domain-containing protein n=1 Tax=Fibroporia radiculosa TaxID=599839 RepID=J4GNC9_9APHY|nr:uncharacterized protein FIBRA_03218 [Fibroporia radiculosa]CCM01170.1 predicted protein [Fibroporia radiculosa]
MHLEIPEVAVIENELGRRPAKRRRITDEYNNPSTRQVILEELDVEIGLRRRLSETIHSRLTWALLLQKALNSTPNGTNHTVSSFKDSALATLDVLEEPCRLLYERDITVYEETIPLIPQPSTALSMPATDFHVAPRQGSSRARGLPRATPTLPKKLLFLRNTTTDPPTIAKLACPDCGRSDFSNLQGLLNHCRLRHQREFGSHDECIQNCAVLVPDDERDWIVANGTELSGISLPSLRRLFEIAVGGDSNVVVPGMQPVVDSDVHSETSADTIKETQLPPLPSTHITRTLGHHEDTPALALFLGRAPKKRIINIHGDQDQLVDIVGLADEFNDRSLDVQRGWRMPYIHRSVATVGLDPETSPVFTTQGQEASDIPAESRSSSNIPTPTLLNITGTRFHIVARISVLDSSLWITPERRERGKVDHTHKWRLSVSSPSYSLHISTFLAKLTITCITDPPPSSLVEPIVITEPPFVVTSTTDKAFLAKLTFLWVGSQNAAMDIEHWVDLDPVHLSHPVLGDKQIFDIELDRNTQLLPIREDVRKVTWKDEKVDEVSHAANTHAAGSSGVDAEAGYSILLREVLSQVPIATKDLKGRNKARSAAASVSFLVPHASRFKQFVLGRQKAIEMSRARALLHAYEEHVASLPGSKDGIPLTTADVYFWMKDENILPRETSKRVAETANDGDSLERVPDKYCRTCGLHETLHPTAAPEDSATMEVKSLGTEISLKHPGPTVCRAQVVLPYLDVHRLLDTIPSTATMYGFHPHLFMSVPQSLQSRQAPTPVDWVTIADPQLVTAIRSISAEWKLTNLTPADDALPGLGRLGGSLIARVESQTPSRKVVDHLVPWAMLATIVRPLVRLLIERGLTVYRWDEDATRTLGGYERARGKRGTTRTEPSVKRLLTPLHIVRGLIWGASTGLTGSALLLGLARLGTAAGTGSDRSDGEEEVSSGQSAVKIEEEEPVDMSGQNAQCSG